jgi:ABC-type transporter Mla maintaining outer membrane lipid asymmetry permease subunit MlaE
MTFAIIGVGVAIAMLACIQGWNAAAHRKDERTATAMSVVFYLLIAVLFGLLVKMTFFA